MTSDTDVRIPGGAAELARHPRSYDRQQSILDNVGLLCADEVGYLSFDDKSADLLYEVIHRRYERKSVIPTTNRPLKEWNEVFPNAACIRRKIISITSTSNCAKPLQPHRRASQ